MQVDVNRQLVEEIVEKVMQSLNDRNTLGEAKKTLLILDKEKAHNPSLSRLEREWNIISPPPSKVDLTSIDKLLILDVSQSLFVKVAIGLVDCEESTLISSALQEAIPLCFVLSNELELLVTEKYPKNKLYQQRFLEYKKTIQSFGIQIVSRQEFDRDCSVSKKHSTEPIKSPFRLKKKVIVEADLYEFENTTIQIPKSSIITPLAIDRARAKGINICRT